MRKRKTIFLFVFVVGITVFLMFGYTKKAASRPKIDQFNPNKIVFVYREGTGNPPWLFKGEKGKYEFAFLEGDDLPEDLKKYFFVNSVNEFLVHGKFSGKKELAGDGNHYRVFEVENWEIIGRVDRGDSIIARIILPDDRLYFCDYK